MMKKVLWALAALVILFFPCLAGDGASSEARPVEVAAITDAHLHIQSLRQAPALVEAMDASGIRRVVLVGSPDATIYRGREGYKGYRSNNRQVMEIAKKYGGRFIPLVALDPAAEGKLSLLKEYLERGARGIKLYSGHSMFYSRRLDSREMYRVYAFASRRKLPVIFHVNGGKPVYLREFEQVLRDFPGLKVICPHFCLSSIKLSRLVRMLDEHPNLSTDISFGNFITDGLRRISRRPDKYRGFMRRFKERVLFATDMVATENPAKNAKYLAATQRAYRDMLEKDVYYYPYLPGEKLNGLALKGEVLNKIYVENAAKIFGRP